MVSEKFFRLLLVQPSRNPLETIATCLVTATICYFSLIHLLHFNEILPNLSTQTVLLEDSGKLSPTNISASFKEKVLLRQFIIDVPKFPIEVPPQGILAKSVLRSAYHLVAAIKNVSISDPATGSEVFYQDLCVKKSGECFEVSPLSLWNNDLNILEKDVDIVNTIDQDYIERGNMTEVFFRNHIYKNVQERGISSASSLALSFFLNISTPHQAELVHVWEQKVRSVKTEQLYPQYSGIKEYSDEFAYNSFFENFSILDEFIWKLREYYETSTSSDILVQLISLFLMYATITSLFINMRRVGSKFILGFTVLSYGVCSLLTSLVIAKFLGIKMNIILLAECLPFLVVTIGFEKPYFLTKTIVESPGNNVREKVYSGVLSAGPGLVTDYAIEALVLLLGSVSGIAGGMKEFCFIAALILTFDCLYLFTMYLSVLVLRMELQIVREGNKNKKTEKSTGLKFFGRKYEKTKGESVILSRTKLMLILTFLAMHALNASSSYQYYGDVDQVMQVDASSPSTVATLGLLHNLQISTDPLVVNVPAPFVLRPVRYDTEELEAVPVTPFIDGIAAIVSKEVNIYRSLFVLVIAALIIAAYVLVNVGDLIKEETQVVEEEVKEAVKPKPVEKTIIIRNDSKLDISEKVAVPKIPVGQARSVEECIEIMKSPEQGPSCLSNEEVIMLVEAGKIPAYALEKVLNDCARAVVVRRMIVSKAINFDVSGCLLPFEHYDYTKVLGVSCENVIGYLPLPVGVAGPLMVDKKSYHLPMATTEGCLVASTSRGCKAITLSGGATTEILGDGMARGPVVAFPSIVQAAKCKRWLESTEGNGLIEEAFNSTSRFGRLKRVKIAVAGKYLFIRFVTFTGDAMGMNMISKGTEKAIEELGQRYPEMRLISISGNYCTDKKPAAVNWIDGRGKSVVAECILSGDVVRDVLKTSVERLVELNTVKNLVGSAIAGSIGGFNAHASNIITAMFLATGQDAAQNVESSNCITIMESVNDGKDLYLSCSMPCIEVGTVGGGTTLPGQAACLDMLGVKGPNRENPGANAQQLARIMCAGVMAGEISLCSALAAGHLVKSHMVHNRGACKV